MGIGRLHFENILRQNNIAALKISIQNLGFLPGLIVLKRKRHTMTSK